MRNLNLSQEQQKILMKIHLLKKEEKELKVFIDQVLRTNL